MKAVCSGWWADRAKTHKVHAAPLVLRDDGNPQTRRQVTHGICPECRAAFIATLPEKKETPR